MELMIPFGLASAALATAYLAWHRHYRGRLLLLAGTGWTLFFLGLTASFQVLPYGPQLFLVGCIVGAIVQHVSDAARQQTDVGTAERSSSEKAMSAGSSR